MIHYFLLYILYEYARIKQEDYVIKFVEMTEDQASAAIKNGEFGEDLTGADRNVAIILTQDWCPQWMAMKRWLSKGENDTDITVFYFVYNRSSISKEFMGFKETVFNNYLIPYVRYYKNGSLIHESNFTSRKRFTGVFNG